MDRLWRFLAAKLAPHIEEIRARERRKALRHFTDETKGFPATPPAGAAARPGRLFGRARVDGLIAAISAEASSRGL